MCMLSLCLILRPLDCRLPGSCVHAVSQANTGLVAISFSRESPGAKPVAPTLAGGFFITAPPGIIQKRNKTILLWLESLILREAVRKSDNLGWSLGRIFSAGWGSRGQLTERNHVGGYVQGQEALGSGGAEAHRNI